jgi:S-adenosylmethionine decarboxylase
MARVAVHSIVEMFDCPPDLLDDAAAIERAVRDASEAAGATVVAHVAHRFSPQGVTAVAVLAESHLSVHTWPEYGYAAADIFTCGETTDPSAACKLLVERLRVGRFEVNTIDRGPEVSDEAPSYIPTSSLGR